MMIGEVHIVQLKHVQCPYNPIKLARLVHDLVGDRELN